MIPLFSSQQVRDADQYAINNLGMPSIILMENAAKNIFDSIFKLNIEFKNNIVGIVCGKGNNGGDGFALARHLLINDFTVFVISLGAEEELKGDALINFRITKNLLNEYPLSKLIIYESPKDLSILNDCSVLIDSMLGTGTRGDLSEPYKTIVQFLNEKDAFKVAVDLPTGLDLETANGEVIFNADLTVTLSQHKTGLFYNKGYINCGQIVVGSIGIGESYYEKLQTNNYLIEPEDAYFGLPEKKVDAHKYSSGKVLVIAGSGQYPGAACLTANAVLRSGSGSCFLAFPKSVKNVAQEKLESSVLFAYNDVNKEFISPENLDELNEKISWADAIAVGPGLGRNPESQKFVIDLLNFAKNKTIVIDADAIFALGNQVYKNISLKNKILTPHHKEFADLLSLQVTELENNLLEYGRNFSLENTCYLVLKGAPTIIFNPMGEIFINSSGNVGMAKFGTGDVLTGIITGFIAQSQEIEDALISAVYLHSLSADLLVTKKTEYGIIPQDIIEEFPNAIKFIINSFV